MTERWPESEIVPGTFFAAEVWKVRADAAINVDPATGLVTATVPTGSLTAEEARAIGVLLIEAAGMVNRQGGEPAVLIDCDGHRWERIGPDRYGFQGDIYGSYSFADIEAKYGPVRKA